jgi:hypothetical protein
MPESAVRLIAGLVLKAPVDNRIPIFKMEFNVFNVEWLAEEYKTVA